MTSQARYNTKTSVALLQLYIVMMDGEEIDLDAFEEITGLSNSTFSRIMKNMNEMIDDLHLACQLQRLEDVVETNETIYKTYRYKLVSRIDYSFTLEYELEDNKKILYSTVIAYLKLKNRQYVGYDSLSNYLPCFTHNAFLLLIKKLKDILAEDLYKDEYQSYIIEDFE